MHSWRLGLQFLKICFIGAWVEEMVVLNNEVIGINIVMKPKDGQQNWRSFIENLVLVNQHKGNAFLYKYYELDGVIHLHERFKNADTYQRHFDFFSAKVAAEFLSLFDVQKLDVYGDVGQEVKKALNGMNANFFSTIARF